MTVHVCICPLVLLVSCLTKHYNILSASVYGIQRPVQGNTLDQTMKLLCAVVRGIIQREDQFVLKLQVDDEQLSRLEELEHTAKNKCAVTRTSTEFEWGRETVLELNPH